MCQRAQRASEQNKREVRTLLGREGCRVECLCEDLDGEVEGLVEVKLVVFGELGLEEGLSGLIIGADAARAPAIVVARGIRLVQLEAKVAIPPGVEERNTKRPETAILRVALLHIAEMLDKLLNGHRLIVRHEIPLRYRTRAREQNVGIRSDASNARGNMPANEKI